MIRSGCPAVVARMERSATGAAFGRPAWLHPGYGRSGFASTSIS